MTIIYVIAIILIIACSLHRMVGISWLSGGIRAWLQETYPVHHSHSAASFRWFPSVTPELSRITGSQLHNTFPGAPGDRRPGAGDGCKMWFVNSWALWWSRVMYWNLRVAARDDALRKVPCDLDASPCLGHAIVCSALAVPILRGSSGSVWRI